MKKTLFITGGSGGIGKAITLKFAENGYNIALNFLRNDSEAKNIEEECKKYNSEVLLLKGDISNEENCIDMVNQAIDRFESIDCLVNNSGITKDGLLVRMTKEDFEQVIDINLIGTFLVSKYVTKHMMKKRKGKIINISSVVGLHGNAGQTNYSSSKAGIIGFTKSLAREVASRNINVNAIAPGFIETNMTEKIDDKKKEEYKKFIPLNRYGTPNDIAELSFFLGEFADYITGQVITIDGGLYI